MGGIIDKHLDNLAEGRTEITTDMICEAERIGYKDNTGCGLMDYYTNGLQNMSKEEMQRAWQQQMLGMAQYQKIYTPDFYSGSLFGGLFGCTKYILRCPYCGK